jgi:Mrr N-terminal domain
VHVLREAGGELEQDEAFERLETRLSDSLLEADRERTPEGELRWRYAARRARQALIAEGLMAKSRPGLWELTSAGFTDR